MSDNEIITMKNVGIYCITNLINKKRYIGQSRNIVNRFNSYRRGEFSNDHITNSVEKYGWDNFKIEVLINCDENELDHYEVELIKAFNTMDNKIGYNKVSGGNTNKVISEETRKKIGEASKGRTFSEESKTKMSQSQKGRKHSEETRKKISESNKGIAFSEEHKNKLSKPKSEETKRKLSEAHKGIKHSEETKKKLSEASKGKTHSEESIKKMKEIREGNNNPFYGRKHSEETKKKMKESHAIRKLLKEVN